MKNLFLFAVCLVSSTVLADEPVSDRRGPEFFESRIRPLLVKHCYECHSEVEQERSGGLLLDRQTGWLAGGETGQAVVPGDVNGSLLIQAVRYANQDLQMPPDEQLDAESIALLEQWIAAGAPGPKHDLGDTEFSQLGDQAVIFEKASTHWAFQPLSAVKPPEVANADWNQHPIDRFIYQCLERRGLTPSEPASPFTLRRRLAYDLTGLPPEGDVMDELTATIDKLLDSPHYGEHLARLWLDVARYADTANVVVPAARPKVPTYYPFAFTFRDYVIVSFNADKPYDQFIKEQLAADLMGFTGQAPEQAALGFIAVTPFLTNPHDFADDAIDTVTRGLMGLTVSCARCHDHKFEPIPTADYYSLHGVFSSINKPAPHEFDEYPLIDGYETTAEQLADFEAKQSVIEKKIAEAKKSGKLIGARRPVWEVLQQSEMAELMIANPGAPTRAIVVKEAKKPINSYILLRGEPDTRGEQVPRRFLKLLDPQQTPFPTNNSGRLALADHIASSQNPLTARVFVNRVWGLLMGSFLVDTPSDFGLQGNSPSHPQLLDWLAFDFIEHGWSVKHLVRQIVTSRTYQQRSLVRRDMAERDPTNAWYHRAYAKRLSIEELRDSALALSGQLDRRLKGRPEPLWGGEYTRRRSIYGLINRINVDATLRAFDFPSPTASADRRTENVVPQQSLFALNSEFLIEQSTKLASELPLSESQSDQEQMNIVFQHIYGRAATSAETKRLVRFSELMHKRHVDPYPLIVQSLLISNEFLYVD